MASYCPDCDTHYDSWDGGCECDKRTASSAEPEPSDLDRLLDEIADEHMRAG